MTENIKDMMPIEKVRELVKTLDIKKQQKELKEKIEKDKKKHK